MLLSCILKLEAAKDGAIPMTHGDLVHAAFLDIVKKNLPEKEMHLVWQLHERDGYKPFTVSHIFGKREFKNYHLVVKENDELQLRITSFDKTLSECFLSMKDETNFIQVGNILFNIAEIITNNFKHNRAGQTTYQDLIKKWSEQTTELPRKFSFNFMSPTAFRDGKQNVLFPLPHLVFYSLAEKWRKYAPEPFGREIQDFQDEIAEWRRKTEGNEKDTKVWVILDKLINVSSYELNTKMLNFRDYKRIGFSGFAEFEVLPSFPDKWLRLLNLLADFSFYAGIGYQTTMGMGQIRRLDEKYN